jgi:ABC-2 type transport system ATP-binding protein
VLVSTHYMDEAERCHEIAYIVGGRTLARGKADEVVDVSGLVTFEAEGAGADRLAAELRGKPGVEMAAPFGTTLHVSGRDRAALEAAIAPYRKDGLEWRETRPTLEDVFIQIIHDLNAEKISSPSRSHGEGDHEVVEWPAAAPSLRDATSPFLRMGRKA